MGVITRIRRCFQGQVKILSLQRSVFILSTCCFLLSPTAEEQLSKRCPCGNCNLVDHYCPQDVSGDHDESIRKEGCVLLSSWLPYETEIIGSCKDLISRHCGIVEFTYSSLQVS